jgi:hypothetical protein
VGRRSLDEELLVVRLEHAPETAIPLPRSPLRYRGVGKRARSSNFLEDLEAATGFPRIIYFPRII